MMFFRCKHAFFPCLKSTRGGAPGLGCATDLTWLVGKAVWKMVRFSTSSCFQGEHQEKPWKNHGKTMEKPWETSVWDGFGWFFWMALGGKMLMS